LKLDKPINENYAAVVVEVKALRELENCDNVQGLSVFGLQAIVDKSVKVGDIGLFFPAETQLSEEFAKMNNLHRHTDRNADPNEKGYFEDNRRVKALRFRGHASNAFFIPLSALNYLYELVPVKDWAGFHPAPGDTFDKIGDHEICRKYVLKEPGVNRGPSAKIKRVDLKVFPVHIDTDNYWRNSDKIPSDAEVIITQKLHGTSGRWGKVPVTQDLTWLEKIARKLGVRVADKQTQLVAGSRMVVKSIDGELEEGKNHFYLTDLWSEWGKKLHDLIPDNFIVYGELVGWTSDQTPIQKDYTYDLEPGQSELYIYRVAVVTEAGRTVDLSWNQVKEFAFETGLKHVPEFTRVRHEDFVVDSFIDSRFYDDWSDNEAGSFTDTPVRLSNIKTVDEGVVVRYDGPQGVYLLKAKSPIFLGHETAMLDAEAVDIEAEEASLA